MEVICIKAINDLTLNKKYDVLEIGKVIKEGNHETIFYKLIKYSI